MHDTASDERDFDSAGLAAVTQQPFRRIGDLIQTRCEHFTMHVKGPGAELVSDLQKASQIQRVRIELHLRADVVHRDGGHHDHGIVVGECCHGGAQAGDFIHKATP